MNLSFNGKGVPTQPVSGGLPARRSRLLRRSSCEGWIGEGAGQPPKSKIDGWEAVVP